MSIVFVQGVNDTGIARLSIGDNGKPNTHFDGSCNVRNMINFAGGQPGRLMFFGRNVRKQPGVTMRRRPSAIFNEISDPDSHKVALYRCAHFCQYTDVPVINHPEKIRQTTRDGVAEMLQGIPGVRMPRTIRFQAEAPEEVFRIAEAQGFEPPYIIRVAGDHGGKSMVRLSGPDDLDLLHVFPFGDTDFYLTEYVDYANPQGEYHKQRIVMVDGEPIGRHAIFDTGWNVHASSRKKKDAPDVGQRELERTMDLQERLIPMASEALGEIWQRLGLDYFGIDCCIGDDGEMLIFEANANMNMLWNKVPELEPRVDLIRDRLCALMSRRSGENVTWIKAASR